jgi:signal transduction histidine kinase
MRTINHQHYIEMPLANRARAFAREQERSDGSFFGDRTQLRQLVTNLARNAIEATENALHEARLVDIRTKSEGYSQVWLEVSDCGVGIQPGDRERIFQPFFTTKEGGLGMGLSISRTIVESHGGRILVEPNQPRGTRFLVFLPNERMT